MIQLLTSRDCNTCDHDEKEDAKRSIFDWIEAVGTTKPSRKAVFLQPISITNGTIPVVRSFTNTRVVVPMKPWITILQIIPTKPWLMPVAHGEGPWERKAMFRALFKIK